MKHPLDSPSDFFAKVGELLEKGESLAIASVIRAEGSTPRGTGAKMIVTASNQIYGTIGGGCVESYVISEAKKVLKDGQARIIECDLGDDSWSGIGMACGGKVEIYLEKVEPKPRMIVFGAGHIAKALCDIATMAGYSVIICDPLSKPEDFPKAERVIDAPYAEALEHLEPRDEDAIVIITRHQADEEALTTALRMRGRYIGMIGSRNRVKLVKDALKEKGISEEELERVHAPIGLDIGAETPVEIAISIMAEVIKEYRGGTGLPKKQAVALAQP